MPFSHLCLIHVLTIFGQFLLSSPMQVSRTWTTEKWCRSVVNPQWPFAYSKYLGHTEERNGRIISNLQDVRHECETRGVQSKCHICKEVNCGGGDSSGDGRFPASTCQFQLQGVSTTDMSKNIPTISDIPWAVGGQHRYDYGGNNVSHICLHMSGGVCQSNYGKNYSHCVVRCWGHSTSLAGRNKRHKPGTSLIIETNRTYSGNTNEKIPTDSGIYHHDGFGVGAAWPQNLPSQSWSYPALAPDFVLGNPRNVGHQTSPQGFTFTLAGDNYKGEPGFTDGSEQDARFNHPEGVAVDYLGYVFVADTGNHAIRMISPHGIVTTVAGNGHSGFQNGNSSSAQFSYPSGICVWRDLHQQPSYHDDRAQDLSSASHRRSSNETLLVFVADTGNHQIRKITIHLVDKASSLERIITNLIVECFSGCGRQPFHKVLQPTPGFADGSGDEAQFDSPRGIAISESGNVYIADTNNHVIRKIDKYGMTSTVAGSIQIVNQYSNDCTNIENCKSSTLVAGVQGFEDGEILYSKFSFPTDLVVTINEDILFVIDGHRLRQINLLQKTVRTIAGNHRQSGRDGLGLHASFSNPQGITMTNDGFIYISDASSCRIRRASYHKDNLSDVSCSDTISTLFRPSGCSSYDDAVDVFNMKVSPVSKNIYYNYEYRNITSNEYGEDFIGRRIKQCIGSPVQPPTYQNKQQGANLESTTRNEILVVGESTQFVQEHPNEGSLMTVSCPFKCSHDDIPIENVVNISYNGKYTKAYIENTSICAAAAHSGLLDLEGGLIDIIITSMNKETHHSDIVQNRIYYGQVFVLMPSSSEIVVETISGAPSKLTDTSCGYVDNAPSQESKFRIPYGLSAFTYNALNDRNRFLYVADRDNNVIRALSATCSFSCENGGYCVGPDKCRCQPGWRGLDCTLPLCLNQCSERKICVAPNKCECIPEYTGSSCTKAKCVQLCENGGTCSAPDTCSCLKGWFDPNCTTPVCEQTCGNGGNCVAPNTCSCPPEWSGHDCRQPVCKQTCHNGGFCIAPNTCQCPPDWSGFDCSQPVCHQGYFEPHSFTDKGINTHWVEFRPCNLSEWCSATNSFECRQMNNYNSLQQPSRSQQYLEHQSGCFAIELVPDALTWFQYLQSWNNSLTPHRRYSIPSPHSWSSKVPQKWNAKITHEKGYTTPWTFQIDRMIAIAQLYNVSQGRYVCANGGKCVAPDTCSCAKGWIGFDCRVPVCEQGFYESNLSHFVEGGSHNDDELSIFEKFMKQNVTYRLDPHGNGYSNPGYISTVEIFVNKTYLLRYEELKANGTRYLYSDGSYQGGYQCSIRAVTEWENYRLDYLFQHPNYYSQYMDLKIEEDGKVYTHWENMGWEATYRRTTPRELHESILNLTNNESKRIYIYTDEGYKRRGVWLRTDSNWTKGKCIIEFKRVCDEGVMVIDLQSTLNGTRRIEDPVVQDTDASFRPRLIHDDYKSSSAGILSVGIECTDHVIRGCYNNGTCVAPNVCRCADGWTGYDCSVPVCKQKCQHNGNCTLPNTCTCEKGWSGEDCSIPLCVQDCNNGGKCIAPDTCQCNQWESTWRNAQVNGGVPLFQTSDGRPQLTGWTGYDCSTPICVQAQSFILNVDTNSPDRDNLIALGGRGKDGKLECDDVKCPQYDEIVLVNNGRSFQTGCGNDPIITGCCYERKSNEMEAFVCMHCQTHVDVMNSNILKCLQNGIQTQYYTNINDIPLRFKERDGETVKICGPVHNPGGPTGSEYYVDTSPFANPSWSNRNNESNFTSDHFLCNRHTWLQGDYIDDAGLSTEKGIGADIGLQQGRHVRVNYNNYIYNQSTNKWMRGNVIAGEGIYACYNGGSCIAPDVCTCKDGYTGFDCKTPLCRHRQKNGQVVGCMNGGHCIDKDTCNCKKTQSILWQTYPHVDQGMTGWTGSDCSIPICTQGYYDPDCNDSSVGFGGEGCYRCANGGICIAPDVCQCRKGWNGFDCTSPICVVEVTPIIREQLMTDDAQKIKIFEMDPCAMKDFDSRLLPVHKKEIRGKCVLPNQCACTCQKQYNGPLCRLLGREYCKIPFHDPWFHRRNVLALDEVFGTRSCTSGYEGAVDGNDKFRSCHLRIYEPTYFVEKTRSILACSLFGIFVLTWFILKIWRRTYSNRMSTTFNKRRQKRD